MKTDVLDSLFGYRDALSALIIQQSPQNPSDQATFLQLLQQRDRLTGAINQLIATQFTNATVDLTQYITTIDADTGQLKSVGSNLQAIQQAITVTDSVVKTVASVIALA